MTKSHMHHSFGLLGGLPILLLGGALSSRDFVWCGVDRGRHRLVHEYLQKRPADVYLRASGMAGRFCFPNADVTHEALGLATYSGAKNVIQSLDQEKPCAY